MRQNESKISKIERTQLQTESKLIKSTKMKQRLTKIKRTQLHKIY